MTRYLSSASAGVLALVAAGCATPVPQALKTTDVPIAFTAPVVADAKVWPDPEWWTSFNNEEMAGLINEAQRNNIDLEIAFARMLQAEARAGVARSNFFPSISGDFDAGRSGNSRTGSFTESDSFSLGLSASYQLDLFGRNRANFRSAREALRASTYAQQTVALSVEANTARAYMTVLALRERLRISRSNIDAINRVLAIVKAKVDNGISSNLDLAQQTAQVAGQQAQIPALEQQEREAIYQLALLLGRAPEGFDIAGKTLDDIRPPAVQPGLASDLLLRRPDIAEAEAALASAHANVDAARAAFFPNIGLSGSGGFASGAIGALFNGSTLLYSVGGSIFQTIFDGGALLSQSDLARAQRQELVANYRGAVLNAFTDVETALGRVNALAEQEKFTKIQADNAAEAFRISEIQYREGVADLLAVLQAQQTLFSAQAQLVQIRMERLQASVSLYQALGGGWVQDAKLNRQRWPIPVPSPAPR